MLGIIGSAKVVPVVVYERGGDGVCGNEARVFSEEGGGKSPLLFSIVSFCINLWNVNVATELPSAMDGVPVVRSDSVMEKDELDGEAIL